MTRLVDRAAGVLGRRLSRRGFVTRSALAGSALAVAPKSYVLRPGTAYAAICNCSGSNCDCGSLCCDGYTDFCCALSGVNACPPGTLMGGWWKVDNSSFCTTGGAAGPRYYMDCNYTCGDCGCGSSGICSRACANADCGCHLGCDHRKLGCTGFRYGQCNQHVACLGPILCRVVTCTPPWVLDPSCGTTVRTDNNTRFHSAPCLEGAPTDSTLGAITSVRSIGGVVQVTGFVRTGAGTTVRIVDGTRRLGRTQADLSAAEVGQSEVEGASWFRAAYPLPVGAHLLCASAEVLSGSIALGCSPLLVPGPAPVGSLDAAIGGPGGLTVAGWALDLDSPDPVQIHVYVDGRFVAATVADGLRPDIADRYPEHEAPTAFSLEIPASEGERRVSVFAIDQGGNGPNSLIGTATVTVGGGAPVGRIDGVSGVVDGIHVTGWAIDPDTAEPVDVHVYVDGVVVGVTSADVERPGLAASFPAYGAAHGFDLVVPAGPGLHEVCVYAIDRAGGDINNRLGCGMASVDQLTPAGALDRVDLEPGGVVAVHGWALPPEGDSTALVTLVVDGRVAVAEPTSVERRDVAAAFGRGERGGFRLSAALPAGPHEIEVRTGDRTVGRIDVDVPVVVP